MYCVGVMYWESCTDQGSHVLGWLLLIRGSHVLGW